MRYFFHLRESGTLVVDEEGLELAGVDAVQKAAVMGARSVIAAEAMAGKLSLGAVIEVYDESGERVLDVRFRDAVTIVNAGAR